MTRPLETTEHGITIVPVERIEVDFEPRRWRLSDERQEEIARHFAAVRQERPSIWNGRVLMLGDFAIAAGTFRGSCFEVDYASFMYWQDHDYPDRNIHDCFAMGTIRSSDGAFVLGVQGPRTFNSGKIYFPCGTPDSGDLTDGRLDFEWSARREVAEETGLDPAEFEGRPGWVTVFAGPVIAHMKLLKARQTAVDLRARILDHLARAREPELSDIRIVRSERDFDPMMPPFVTAYLRYAWRCLP